MSNRSLPPTSAVESWLQWLSQARLGPNRDDELLLTNLRTGDLHRWEVGVLTGRVSSDDQGSPFVTLTFLKPNKRNERERDDTEYLFDPETVFVFLLHIVAGGSLRIYYSPGHSGDVYHYPAMYLPGSDFMRSQRLIADTPPDLLRASRRANYHDFRRKSLGITKTIGQVTATHGVQNGKRYRGREDAIATSRAAYTKRGCTLLGTPEQYAELLREAYRVLDLKPLGNDHAC